ncbi:MAG: hypothetical protein DMG46_11775, partial [Acidobacteria bacterium]
LPSKALLARCAGADVFQTFVKSAVFLLPILWPLLNCLTGVEAFESKKLQFIICLLLDCDEALKVPVRRIQIVT